MSTYVLCPLSTFVQAMAGATAGTGVALNGGLIWTYQAGTSTPVNTWTDSTGSVLNSNPIQLNTFGQLNNVNIYQLAGTKIKVQFSTNAGTVGSPVFGTQIGPTFDNVVGIGDITVVAQNTYYGGADTGSANAYILNFSATFTTYVNGTVIYWIPTNNNTGASTLNVNGLGAINITYASGNALQSGQLIANQIAIVAVSGGAFVYLGPSAPVTTGSATFTGVGFSGTVNIPATYSVSGNSVTWRVPTVTGTSNSTGFSMSYPGAGGALAPGSNQLISVQAAEDNGSVIYSQVGVVQPTGLGHFQIVFYKNGNSTGWTNTGTKGLGDGGSDAITFTYLNI